ncbi:MAG: NAD(P)/FAD-dependent oxidoreductase [Waterburya sp.]
MNISTAIELEEFDVAILGTGLAGSMLGAILAKNQARVLLIEERTHPKFAIGESTIPQTSMMMQILSDRFDVPEIKNCSYFPKIRECITSACGIKRNFGFVYHREGQPQNPQEVTQNVISEFPHGAETHMFRQDVDSYMFYSAIKYGAVGRQNTSITDIQISDRGVRLESSKGEQFQARYVIDAGGFRSFLAQKYDLRENPTRMKTHSRSLFTHMVGVKPYDDCMEAGIHGMPSPWSEGTLHHIFDGGWLWVIPFNNNPNSTNMLCSVGLTLDSRRYPKTNLTPEQEFQNFLSRFPDIQKQFQEATPVRDWVSTQRLQYSSQRTTGDRFCLMTHAAGFIDPLFSRGLANATETINALAPRLLQAIADNDFSPQRFEYVDQLQQSLLNYNDRLVNCSFIAFTDFNLWNAWYRIWAIGVFFGWLRLNQAHTKYQQTGDASYWTSLDNPTYLGSICPNLAAYEELFEAASCAVEAAERKLIDPDQAAERIWKLLEHADFLPPMFKFSDRNQRHTPQLSKDMFLRLFFWVKSSSPEEVQQYYR